MYLTATKSQQPLGSTDQQKNKTTINHMPYHVSIHTQGQISYLKTDATYTAHIL